jgi:hypothetical protein
MQPQNKKSSSVKLGILGGHRPDDSLHTHARARTHTRTQKDSMIPNWGVRELM